MIIWSSGQGPRLLGCGTLLLASLVITVVVFVLSGGHCALIVFP
ncbi:MAG: hypothetical protein QOF51_506 [Chloroflexota bacterium]|jgi:hypothetical protein|nr:hypothetical protein [Chloroflexota bacterium]